MQTNVYVVLDDDSDSGLRAGKPETPAVLSTCEGFGLTHRRAEVQRSGC